MLQNALAIAAALVVLVGGCGLSLLVLRSLDKRFLLFYLASGAFLLLGIGASALCITAVAKGIWLVPGILFVAVSVMLGNLLFNIAREEQFLYRHHRLKAPVTAKEVSRGIDWKELEKWLLKSGK